MWRGGGGSVVRKTPDTALYSIYVGTLWLLATNFSVRSRRRFDVRRQGRPEFESQLGIPLKALYTGQNAVRTTRGDLTRTSMGSQRVDVDINK